MVGITSSAKFAILGLAAFVAAHPGHHEEVGNLAKRDFLARSRRSLDSCADHLDRRGTLKAAAMHRRAIVAEVQKKHQARKFQERDTDSAVNSTHLSSDASISMTTDPSTLFSSNQTCILNPTGEVGPFWVKGELNRQDISDNEPGIANYIHAQFIDVATCLPIPDLWWDVWNCNSTGVYSGVQDDSNGNGDDASNLDNTALRGIQRTDDNGIAMFKSVFPGHYSGRATHVHVIAHTNATLLSNATITGGVASHIGQFFFDQDLISQVEATYPYNTSDVDITLNSDDRVVADETDGSNSDPFFNYVLLGDDVEDGVFSWITVGVDTTQSYNTSYAALLTQNGGVKNENGGMGDGMGGSPSGVPSGAVPSGTAGSVAPTASA
ncbi:hypothetical protein N0V90_002480 [Kalmusia sp. IMI 367209]|nr:hypothetical protein N0V90_002480 [Kalmusia sp. IMI 367209]